MTREQDQQSTSKDVCLPYVTLQPDFAQVYTDVSQGLHTAERAWLSVYCMNAPKASIHAKLMLTHNRDAANGGVDVDLESSSKSQLSIRRAEESRLDFSVASTSKNGSLMANTTKASITLPETRIRIPKRTLGPIVKGSIGVSAFDISDAGNDLYVAGGADGQAHIGRLGTGSEARPAGTSAVGSDDIETIAQRRMQERAEQRSITSKTYLKGHVGDIRSAKFFPSGEVVLTTSSDCTARVFGIDGQNPRTLKGHRRAILDSDFIDRGKQVLTASMDGTTRLWDVSEGKQLSSFGSQNYSGVNRVKLDTSNSSSKFFFTGLSNGTVEAFDTSSKTAQLKIGKVQFPSGPAPQASDSWKQIWSGSIESMDISADRHALLLGCGNGITLLHDMRMLSNNVSESEDVGSKSLLGSWQRNGAAINDVQFVNGGKEALFATSDGTPYRCDLGQTDSHDLSPRVLEEYNGWDVDNVEICRFDQTRSRVWLAGADGMVRMY
ncbi:WD40 repeat-like protein [Meira miltonrushii]|uniref:WD40 repeat-like protein n=1 Tax=Meira miltonrushii TaxID=1280837 RepID=A0A316V6Y4_9BASI|nr:WD40 repeat-like protein [Meira miltonrushii]PWN33357.1 WD40 repeat-like protein [Meira miltonrushii]